MDETEAAAADEAFFFFRDEVAMHDIFAPPFCFSAPARYS
jgi:hypothetical protein